MLKQSIIGFSIGLLLISGVFAYFTTVQSEDINKEYLEDKKSNKCIDKTSEYTKDTKFTICKYKDKYNKEWTIISKK